MAAQVSEAQNTEVEQLKEAYGKSVKVIKNIGDFSNVVDVKLGELDCSVKFQLEGAYPDSLPHVIIKCNKMNGEEKEALSLHLATEAGKLKGEKMLEQLINAAKLWTIEKDLDLSFGPDSPKNQRSPKIKTDRQKKKIKSEDEALVEEKLPSMKTSMDVISRILWDEKLPKEDFRIGYLDRHIGLIERNFTAFSWEDIASVDYHTLAIPKHRICYFKYKSIVVWEKEKRLDNIFGSTGSGITIHNVIEQYKKDLASAVAADTPLSHECNNSDESDIEIDLGDQNNDTELHEDIDKDTQDEQDALNRREQYWGKKKRPTHFLCLRVTDTNVKDNITEIHPGITSINAEYHDCLIPADRLHVTLACLGLDTEDQVQYACDVLRNMQPELQAWNPALMKLNFTGVDQFHHSVVYSKVHVEPRFFDFNNELRDRLTKAGVEIRDVFDFTPHMTIMKMKKRHGHEFKCKYLDTTRIFGSIGNNTEFGSQYVDKISLCEMSDDRQPDGFYITPAQISFQHFSNDDYEFK